MSTAAFFAFARERHRIFLRRSLGVSRDRWTKDEILSTYRFTNVFRELDATTVWLREQIRGPMSEMDGVLNAVATFRWFNKIEIGEILTGNMPDGTRQTNLLTGRWSTKYAERRLRRLLPSGPWTNGAYVISSPQGVDKLSGVLQSIDNFRAQRGLLEAIREDGTLRGATDLLSGISFLGRFMAYELVTDLRYTYLLRQAPDIHTWANPGPGARRGLGRVFGSGPDSTSAADDMLRDMRDLLRMSRYSKYWPVSMESLPTPIWEMREVEHTLCEFDKYERARHGEGRPKQIYR